MKYLSLIIIIEGKFLLLPHFCCRIQSIKHAYYVQGNWFGVYVDFIIPMADAIVTTLKIGHYVSTGETMEFKN